MNPGGKKLRVGLKFDRFAASDFQELLLLCQESAAAATLPTDEELEVHESAVQVEGHPISSAVAEAFWTDLMLLVSSAAIALDSMEDDKAKIEDLCGDLVDAVVAIAPFTTVLGRRPTRRTTEALGNLFLYGRGSRLLSIATQRGKELGMVRVDTLINESATRAQEMARRLDRPFRKRRRPPPAPRRR